MTLRVLLIALLIATPVFAVQPDEILDDPVLEARARELSKGLRCLVCRNENIDDSNADLARDLRLLVRERLLAGDTDDEVIEFVVARYGEYVLLKPRGDGANMVLWIAGPLMLVMAGTVAVTYLRRRKTAPRADDLTEAESRRVAQLLED